MSFYKRYSLIIKDAIILITISTLFVTAFNQVFKKLKKSNQADSLITAIVQSNEKDLKEILSETGYKDEPLGFTNFKDYLAGRVNKQDEQGRTPLMWAAYINYSDSKKVLEADKKRTVLTNILVSQGADVSLRDKDGWTALMWASWSGLTEVAKELVAKGSDLNAADKLGNTALMLSSFRANQPIVQLLVEKGADTKLVDSKGRKALDFAKEGMRQYPDRSKLYSEQILVLQNTTDQDLGEVDEH